MPGMSTVMDSPDFITITPPGIGRVGLDLETSVAQSLHVEGFFQSPVQILFLHIARHTEGLGVSVSSSDGHSSPLALEICPLLERLVSLEAPSAGVHTAAGVSEGHGGLGDPPGLGALTDRLVGAGAHLGGDSLFTHVPLRSLV